MAVSACPPCKKTSFELADASISKTKQKNLFVQCSACGAVVAVMSTKDAGLMASDCLTEIRQLRKEVAAIAAMIPRK